MSKVEVDNAFPSYPAITFIEGFTQTGGMGTLFLTSGSKTGFPLVHEFGHSYYGFSHSNSYPSSDNIMHYDAASWGLSKILKLPFNIGTTQLARIINKRIN